MAGNFGTLFLDSASRTFEYRSNEKVAVIAFQSEDSTEFPSIDFKITDRPQPGSEWTEGIPLNMPNLLAATVRSFYHTLGPYGVKSTRSLLPHKNIFFHSLVEDIKKGFLKYSLPLAQHIADSRKLMICGHGYPKDTDNAYLNTRAGKRLPISYIDLAKYIAQHIAKDRTTLLTIDLSICYAARSLNYKKVHTFELITEEDIKSSFSYKFTKELAKLLPNTPIEVKSNATAVTFDYSSGIRKTELEAYFQNPKEWSKQNRGEDYFDVETLSFTHKARPEYGLLSVITVTDDDEVQISRTFRMQEKGMQSGFFWHQSLARKTSLILDDVMREKMTIVQNK